MKQLIKADQIIEYYNLEPHPEGGYFTETYRSEEKLDAKLISPLLEGERAYSTAIYFLLKSGQKSQLHRLPFNEIFHFYLGDTLDVWVLYPDQSFQKVVMGQNIFEGELVQYRIPANTWFGAIPRGDFSFIGCTLAPGFDYRDFELRDTKELLNEYPKAKDMILNFID